MGLTVLSKIYWLAGFLGQLVLLGILVGRRRTSRFPLFTLFIAFQASQTITNFAVYTWGSRIAYFWTYWGLGCAEALLQICVVYEMAREVLRPTGRWTRDGYVMFLALGLLGAVLAAALSFAVNPRASHGLGAWTIRLNLFTSLLIAELIIAMFLAASRVGLQWRNWVMGLAEGLGIWICISLGVETAHSYWGWTKSYLLFDYLRMSAYITALGYWCVCLWRNEPERKPLSPEMHKYLEDIGHSLEYDLQVARAARKK